jgi:hypothetical protein
MSETHERDALAQSTEYAAKHAAPQTNVVVVAPTGDAAKRWVVDFVWVNGDAAGTLQLKDSDNADIAGYFFTFGANGGVCIEKAFLEKLGLNKGLRYSTTGGGNHSVIIKYHEDFAR